MQGFEGPFRFDIDSDGMQVPWDRLAADVRKTLERESELTGKNAKVYLCRITVVPQDNAVERHHDWAKVSRVLVQAKTATKRMKIVAIYPPDTLAKHAQQNQMDFMGGFEGGVNLFGIGRFKLSLSSKVKQNATINRYCVLSSFLSGMAQWVYSPGWDKIGYEMFIGVVVPNELPKAERHLLVTVTAVRKGNVPLTLVAVHDRLVALA